MSKLRAVSSSSALALGLFPVFVGCSGGLGSTMSGLVAASCPADVLSLSSIQSAKFGLEAELEGKAKAALSSGAIVAEIAADMEASVLRACTNIATDLGVTADALRPSGEGPGAKVKAACGAAAKAVGDVRATLQGELRVEAKPPVCYADANVMAECAGKCDASIDPGSVEVECEGGKLAGKCGGTCEGTCTVQAGAQCQGSCSGTCQGGCSGDVSGKCDGKCEGKCDGKDSSGKCAGTCEGTCKGESNASCRGTCEGRCDASCEMQAQGECNGTCSGSCSVEFEEPKCEGEVKPPEMSAECQAQCEADVTAKLECHPGHVEIAGDLQAQTEQVTALIATLETNLPALIQVATTMKARAGEVVASARASVKGMKATLEGAGGDAVRVAGCFASSLEAQAQASAKISVSVEASASVSGKASGSI